MRVLLLFIAAVLLNAGVVRDAHDEERASILRCVRLMPEIPCDIVPLPIYEAPKNDDTHYSGFTGRWVKVCATAYTPTNPIDGDYHATKGAYRWKTADGKTDVRSVPYGIAVPQQKRTDGKKRPEWDFGTKVIIPTGHGYLDKIRKNDRIFPVDDTSESSLFFRSKNGCLHIDVRFVDTKDAIKWAGPTGYRFISVFVIDD